MNLFLLSLDPRLAALWHCDKHVRKMGIELVQMLYSAHWINRGIQAGFTTQNVIQRVSNRWNPKENVLSIPSLHPVPKQVDDPGVSAGEKALRTSRKRKMQQAGEEADSPSREELLRKSLMLDVALGLLDARETEGQKLPKQRPYVYEPFNLELEQDMKISLGVSSKTVDMKASKPSRKHNKTSTNGNPPEVSILGYKEQGQESTESLLHRPAHTERQPVTEIKTSLDTYIPGGSQTLLDVPVPFEDVWGDPSQYVVSDESLNHFFQQLYGADPDEYKEIDKPYPRLCPSTVDAVGRVLLRPYQQSGYFKNLENRTSATTANAKQPEIVQNAPKTTRSGRTSRGGRGNSKGVSAITPEQVLIKSESGLYNAENYSDAIPSLTPSDTSLSSSTSSSHRSTAVSIVGGQGVDQVTYISQGQDETAIAQSGCNTGDSEIVQAPIALHNFNAKDEHIIDHSQATYFSVSRAMAMVMRMSNEDRSMLIEHPHFRDVLAEWATNPSCTLTSDEHSALRMLGTNRTNATTLSIAKINVPDRDAFLRFRSIFNGWTWREIVSASKAFRPSHGMHPIARWIRTSPKNYQFAADLAVAIMSEFNFRWNKMHACTPHAFWLRENFPPFPFETRNEILSGISSTKAAHVKLEVETKQSPSFASLSKEIGPLAIEITRNSNHRSISHPSSELSPPSRSAFNVGDISDQGEETFCPEIEFESREDPRLYPLDIPDYAKAQSQTHFLIPYPSVDEPTYYCTEGIPEGCTPFPLAMPSHCKQPNAVEAYRYLYQTEKKDLLQYTRRSLPPWIDRPRN